MAGGHGAGADGAARSPRAQRQRQGEEHLRTRAEDKHDERSQRRGQCSGSTYAHHAEIHCDVDSHPCWVVITILWGPTKSVLVVLLVVRAWAAQRSLAELAHQQRRLAAEQTKTGFYNGLRRHGAPLQTPDQRRWATQNLLSYQLPNANSTNELRHGCGIRPT